MNKSLLISFIAIYFGLMLCAPLDAAPGVAKNTYTCTEIDLKMQLHEVQIKSLEKELTHHQESICTSIEKQEKNNADNYTSVSNQIGMYGWWMTYMSILVAFIIFGTGLFFSWKVKKNMSDVNAELEDIRKTKAEIKKLKSEIEKSKYKAKSSLSEIEAMKEELKNLLTKVENTPREKLSSNDEKEISSYVEKINKTIPEADLTAEDWFLKGYDAHMKDKFADACFYYQKAIDLEANHARAYNNWGTALFGLARQTSDDSLYKQSFEKYEKAIELKPDDTYAYCNWGNALSEHAKQTSNVSLYQQSFEKYKKAIELKPDYVKAYNNWEIALKDMKAHHFDGTVYDECLAAYKKVTKPE